MLNSYKAIRVLVTGGSGFIGTNLVEHFAHVGADVANFDLVQPRNRDHCSIWRRVDILNFDSLFSAIDNFKPEVVLHFAARTDLDGHGPQDYAANTIGVSNLIECIRNIAAPRLVIFASSMLVCRLGYTPRHELDFCPTTAYGLSKCQGEKLVRERAKSSFPWIILRPTSLWGPWFSSPYQDFFAAVGRGVYFHPRGMEVKRSYGFILNAVHQIAKLVSSRPPQLLGRAVYLADYQPIEVRSWAQEIQKCLAAPPIREVPPKLLAMGALLGDGLKAIGWRDVPLTSFRLRNLLTQAIYDTSELKAVCGPVPYTMSEGVGITCNWMRSQSLPMRERAKWPIFSLLRKSQP